jgi:hypothetical protein
MRGLPWTAAAEHPDLAVIAQVSLLAIAISVRPFTRLVFGQTSRVQRNR